MSNNLEDHGHIVITGVRSHSNNYQAPDIVELTIYESSTDTDNKEIKKMPEENKNCTRCIHKEVCKHISDFNNAASAVAAVTESLPFDTSVISIAIKCKKFQTDGGTFTPGGGQTYVR